MEPEEPILWSLSDSVLSGNALVKKSRPFGVELAGVQDVVLRAIIFEWNWELGGPRQPIFPTSLVGVPYPQEAYRCGTQISKKNDDECPGTEREGGHRH